MAAAARQFADLATPGTNAALNTAAQCAGMAAMRQRLQDILDSADKIPQVSRRGDWFYNLWRDAQNPRGLWRRTTLDDYRKAQPAWETVIDLDALGKAEGENWVWSGATALGPGYRRCLVQLSRGGADATVVREFDLVDKRFVPDGFKLPEAKTDIVWIDADSVYIGSDFGPGSLTDSGYPRVIKRWRRGQPVTATVRGMDDLRESISDRCEDVANLIEGVVLENS